ncbi:MAG TPA: tripartite tricarboxylate transporter substrate binding protein [Usitatibacteraceae bacterium]|nr:tripartite tricarboxylate transporter substrate binding protein [Usitatibacteraceae bacterium]
MKRRTLLCTLAAALALPLALSASLASAQAWPNKPVKFINPFPAGGGTDVFARPFAAKLGAALGQSIIIENLGGAGGTVGAAVAAKAPNDGYTFFVGAIHHTIAESLYLKKTYKLEEDFIPVTVLAYVPNVLVVHPKHPFKTEAELKAYMKANPGKINFGSAGSGASHHLAGELYKRVAGVDMVHVPYKGIGPMMQDLLGGVVDLAFDGLGSSSAQIKGGKLNPLAVTSRERNALLPNVPTMVELGYPEFTMTTWYALWAIKGTPQPILDRMHAEAVKTLNDPDIKAAWAAAGATAGGQSPKEFGAFISSEIAKWGKVVKDANIKIDN